MSGYAKKAEGKRPGEVSEGEMSYTQIHTTAKQVGQG